jgi:UDPglucose 6-dehydrogenase
MYAALADADALLIVTEWQVFKEADLDQVGKKLKNRVIFDGRNLYDPAAMRKRGYHYESIGRPQTKA